MRAKSEYRPRHYCRSNSTATWRMNAYEDYEFICNKQQDSLILFECISASVKTVSSETRNKYRNFNDD